MNSLKTAEEWQKELAGETSIESIRLIQKNALEHAADLVENALVNPNESPMLVKVFISNEIIKQTENLK